MADDEDSETVTATVELSGEYERVADILSIDGGDSYELSVVTDAMNQVLDIVTRTGGATKGRIADELPADTTERLDADSVIHVLRVLELYDVVVLDGNTWRPGPALSASD